MSDPLIAYWFAMADKQGRAYSPNKPDEKWEVGKTRTLDGEIIPCRYGFHGSPTLWQALRYAPGPLACKVELGGTIIEHGGDKIVASQKTLLAAVRVERELRLFAVDCAEHVLHVYESAHPDDDRPRKAIAAARDYADGRGTYEALLAAKAAAWNAAKSAARAAAWAAGAAAAEAAAKSAAAAAAEAVVAEWSEEHEWQRRRFEELFAGIFGEGSA